MAKQHNAYGRLLGTVENDPQPLVGGMPMSNVPDLEGIAAGLEDTANWHTEAVKGHADRLRQVAQFQPKFDPPSESRLDG